MIVKDIEGTILQIGDVVYYARKRNYTANGELVEATITSIHVNGNVSLGKWTSTSPDSQLIKKK
jgi:hypothetical protein